MSNLSKSWLLCAIDGDQHPLQIQRNDATCLVPNDGAALRRARLEASKERIPALRAVALHQRCKAKGGAA